jgi:hypothetical protein
MTKFLIERKFHVGEADMPEVSRRSKRIAIDSYPEITWLHSHVVVDSAGTVKTYCIYEAPTELAALAPQQVCIGDVGDHEDGDGLTLSDLASDLRIPVTDEIQRLLIEGDRLLLRPAAPGQVACNDEIIARPAILPRFPPMLCESRRSRGNLRRRLFEKRRDLLVSRAPLRTRERCIRGVADQVVLEAELLVPAEPGDGLTPDEVSPLERVE